MKYVLSLLSLLFLSATMHAQNLAVNKFALPDAPDAPSQHRFWTFENKVDTGILAALIGADGITTQRGLSEGLREAVGVAYCLHRTHHYKAERITMRLMIAGESAVVANNIVQIH